MKKFLKKIFVNYGAVIFFYITIVLATISFASDYKIYDTANEVSNATAVIAHK